MPPMLLLFILLGLLSAAKGQLHATDQAALASFYDSLEQKGTLSWNTNKNLCDSTYSGKATDSFISTVVCSSGSPQKVTQLHLYRQSLVGTFPSALTPLTSLTHLYLSGNSFHGPLGDPSALSSLNYLNLDGNAFTGTIPSTFGALPGLIQLNLNQNNLAGPLPTELGRLSNLQILDLSNNPLDSTLPIEIGSLLNLHIFYASGAKLKGTIPSQICALGLLQELTLSSNNLTGTIPTDFGLATELFGLYLNGNNLSGNLPSTLGNLFNLVTLDLSSNRIDGSIPTTIGALSNIDVINLYSNQLSGSIPTEIGLLSYLTALDLGNNQLTGSIPSTVGSLSNLSLLDLAKNALTGTLPTALVTAGIKDLYLDSNRFCPLDDYSRWALFTDYVAADCSSCSPIPCFNNGTCRYSQLIFSCVCSAGYNGTNCENRITCPAITESNAAWVQGLSLTQVSGTCQTNYVGSPTRTCQANGTWSSISNPCQAQCPSTLEFNATWPATLGGQTVSGTCNSGFSGSISRTCVSAGNWGSVTGSCTRNVCPSEVKNSLTWPATDSLTSLTLSCPSGFTGNPTRTCQANGTWTSITDGCVAIPKCPGETVNNSLWLSTYELSSSYGSCVTGYSGSPARPCFAGGVWGSISNPCSRNTCPSESNGYITWPTTDSLTNITLSCPPGFYGNNSTRTCQANGVWTSNTSPCVPSTACVAETFNNAAWGITAEGYTAAGSCLSGYSGSPSRLCQVGGFWSSFVTLPCVRNTCPSEIYVNITWPITNSLTNATGTCSNVTLGTPSRFCQANGTWSTDVINPCGATCASVDYNKATWPMTLGGDTANGACIFGYAGNPNRKCMTNGTWASLVQQNCARLSCAGETYNFVTWPTTNSLQYVTLNCPTGFTGRPKRYCGNGTWDDVTNPCISTLNCLTETYQSITWPETPASTVATGTCASGFSGSPKRACLTSQNWNSTVVGSCSRNQCPSTQEGAITWPVTNSLTDVTLICPSGYYGNPFRTCQANGTWTSTLNPCTPILNCAAEMVDNTTWSTTTGGVVALGTCDVGFSGSPSRMCFQSGVWNSTIVNPCTRNVCPAQIKNYITWPATNSLVSLSNIACPAGTSGTSSRTCQANGTWAEVVNPCQETHACPSESYQGISWPAVNENSAGVIGSCAEGFSGSPKRNCLTLGIWDSVVTGTCTRNRCNNETASNAFFPATDSLITQNGTCVTGYTGTLTRPCLANGTWSSSIQGTCTQTNICPESLAYAHADWPITNAGVNAVGVCNSGYSGTPRRLCGTTGAWASLVTVQCTRNQCPVVTEGYVSWPATLSLNTVTIPSCPTGYSGRPFRSCLADGSWGPISNPCVPA